MTVGEQLLFKYRLDRVQITAGLSLVSVKRQNRCLVSLGQGKWITPTDINRLHAVCSMDQLIYIKCYVKL